jgi:hypothetical protein
MQNLQIMVFAPRPGRYLTPANGRTNSNGGSGRCDEASRGSSARFILPSEIGFKAESDDQPSAEDSAENWLRTKTADKSRDGPRPLLKAHSNRLPVKGGGRGFVRALKTTQQDATTRKLNFEFLPGSLPRRENHPNHRFQLKLHIEK